MNAHERAIVLGAAMDALRTARTLTDFAGAYGVSKDISRLLRGKVAREIQVLIAEQEEEEEKDNAPI